MSRKIKVRKSLGKANVLVKIERNNNVANQIPLHAVVTDPPHAPDAYLEQNEKVNTDYTKHLTGDKEATISMYGNEKIMDSYYYDTAEYIEILANDHNDTTLPISMGFEVYAEKKPRAKKDFTIRDGNSAGEIFVSVPKLEGATAYRVEMAEVIEDKDPAFGHGGACSITFIVVKNVKSDTKYLIRYNGIFSSGEGAPSDFKPFHTKEWI
jgi:hypothetical protein